MSCNCTRVKSGSFAIRIRFVINVRDFFQLAAKQVDKPAVYAGGSTRCVYS